MQHKAEVADTQFGTARIFAFCDCFDKAKRVRDAATRLREEQHTPELSELDEDFTTRYRAMIARHEREFEDLFAHLDYLIRTLKQKAAGQRLTADAKRKRNDAINATLIIEKVSKSAVSPKARDNVIHALSPRAKRLTVPYRPTRRGMGGSPPAFQPSPPGK